MLLSLPLNFYVMFDKLDAAEHSPAMQHIHRGDVPVLCAVCTLKGRHVRLYVVATVILLAKIISMEKPHSHGGY